MAQEGRALVGDQKPPRLPVEEGHAQVTLQRADRLGHRGLRDRQRTATRVKAPETCEPASAAATKNCKLAQIGEGHGVLWMLGAWYVVAAVWGVASLGVVTLVAAMVFGQMAAALVIDATGILGMTVREITPTRIAAAGMVLGGLVLSRL
jgi:hypothetical protein